MNAMVEKTPQKSPPNAPTQETVLEVQHWTDSLFSFRITRPESFRFRSGEFVMLGLETESKPIMRAYSMANPAWEETLEFFSIKVPNGPLTSRLQKIQPGDKVLLGRKPTGTLVMDALVPGRRLFLFSTGTGIAPFASIVRDLETYEKFDAVFLTHTCRYINELQYGHELVESIQEHEFLGDMTKNKLFYYNSITRETFPRNGRITELIQNRKIFDDLGVPHLNPEKDRAMICGSTDMNRDMKALMLESGLTEGANNKPGEFVLEKAFAG